MWCPKTGLIEPREPIEFSPEAGDDYRTLYAILGVEYVGLHNAYVTLRECWTNEQLKRRE